MSARSTGRSAVTVTVPLARSTVTVSTPPTAEISSVTARSQCAHVMPRTAKVVAPMKVRGVSLRMGTPREARCRIGRRRESPRSTSLSPGIPPGFSPDRLPLTGFGDLERFVPGPVAGGRYRQARVGRTGQRARGGRRAVRRRLQGKRRGAGRPRRGRVRQVRAAGRSRDGGVRHDGAAYFRGGVGVTTGLRRAAAAAVAAT